jgi:hypothetical protein
VDRTGPILDTCLVLTARVDDWGFVVSADLAAPERSSDGRWRLVYVDGLKDQLQFATVTVLAEAEHQIVVLFAYKEEPQAIVEAVARCFPTHTPATVREDTTGWARATCADSASHELVVAAVAVCMAIGSWDESIPILVELEDSQFEAFLELRDERWHARVERSR